EESSTNGYLLRHIAVLRISKNAWRMCWRILEENTTLYFRHYLYQRRNKHKPVLSRFQRGFFSK
ncbi:hypothetical protein EZS27_042650, partial [termite gut metagenome]